INHEAQKNEIDDDRGGDKFVAKAHARQTSAAAVIFRDGLQFDAPPEIPVDLKVPLVPARVGGIAPAFFFEQLKDRAEQMMPIFPILAPINAASSTSFDLRLGGQMFARSDDRARGAFEMKPGEIARKSAHERLDESQHHNEQTRVYGVEFR